MVYVILSGFLYVLSIMYPAVSWIGMMTFLIPLVVSKLPGRISLRFWYGLLWGMIVFTIHWSWALALLMARSANPISYLLWFLLVIWYGCLSGLWFCFFPLMRLWSTVLFFIFLSKCSMWFTGVIEGYPFSNPLVSLAFYPWIINGLYWLSDFGMLIVIFSMQIAVVDLYRQTNNYSLKILVSCILVLMLGSLCAPTLSMIHPKSMVTLCPWWYGCGDPMFAGYRMSHDINIIVQKHPEAEIVVMPESTYCWDIQEYKPFLSIWSDSANSARILFGAHEIENGVSHNAVFLLHNGEIVFRYRKQHFMPLIERSIWLEKLCNQSLLGGLPLLLPTISDDKDLITIGGVVFQIFICSEFFFECKEIKGYPVLLLWNDSWFHFNWAKQLATLFIVYFEKKYCVLVLHMSTRGVTNIN